VEVLSSIEGWTKVREHGGRVAWVESRALTTRRSVLVSSPAATVREAATDAAPAVFDAQRGLILDIVEVAGGWVRVRHRDGLAGYLRATEVWGL
jgi:SH3-like domain-containing protein